MPRFLKLMTKMRVYRGQTITAAFCSSVQSKKSLKDESDKSDEEDKSEIPYRPSTREITALNVHFEVYITTSVHCAVVNTKLLYRPAKIGLLNFIAFGVPVKKSWQKIFSRHIE